MRTNSLAVLLVLAAGSLGHAELRSKSVPYEHDAVQLEGYLAWDDAISGKRPGVLVVHEWWGLNDYARRRADQLAEMGYVAFALDMYGKGKLTEHPQEAREWASQIRQNVDAWRQRARAGLEVLGRHELVDTGRLAAMGYCFGGATVLQLAYAGEPLAGVVSFHGSLPVATEEQAKNIKSKVLICHGAADTFIPEEQAGQFREALEKAGVDWQMIYYGGARHSFTDPAADDHGVEGLAYHAEADRRSWSHLRTFLEEAFRR